MRLAKATPVDIEVLQAFFTRLEEMQRNQNEEGEDHYYTPDEFGIFTTQAMHGAVGTAWRRVVYGCETLINNCCDPNETYLAWKPELIGLMPKTVSDTGEKLYYIISYKHTKNNILAFWRAGDSGYTDDLRQAGLYTESWVRSNLDYYHQENGNAVAIPAAEMHDGRFQITHRVEENLAEKDKHMIRVAKRSLEDPDPHADLGQKINEFKESIGLK